MRKVLYITDSVVPYRSRFFNLLSQSCRLSVLYESRKVGNRNAKWRNSVPLAFHHHFLDHRYFRSIFSTFELLMWVSRRWDVRVIGCINSKIEILAILYMRLFHIPYYLNLDGETFFEGNSPKAKLKRFVARGAKKYLVAGNKSAENLRNAIGNVDIQVYNFSSLSEQELISHRHSSCILTVGGAIQDIHLLLEPSYPTRD